MKRLLFIPTCTLLALGALTSCQKEDKSALQLAEELTAELQTVTNHQTAEAAAPRVEVLNKRLQDANVRTCTLNTSALLRSANLNSEGHEADAYVAALCELAREVARVRASLPVTSYDGEVDEQELIMAVGVSAETANYTDSAAARTKAGRTYLEDDVIETHKEPVPFTECYGSSALKAALDYTPVPAEAPVMRFDSEADVPAIPEKKAVEEIAGDDLSVDDLGDDAAADDAAAEEETDDASASAEETSEDSDTAVDDAADSGDSLDLDLDLGGDDTTTDSSAEEETTTDDSSDSLDDSLDLDIEI